MVFGFGSPVLYQPDADCGFMPRPCQDVQRFFSKNYINQWGMRCGEIQRTPSAGTERAFFIGDSVTYATSYVDQQKIWTSLLGNSLPAVAHHPVEVLNMSAGGWAPPNEAGYLKSRGTFHSQIVLIVMTSGDLGGEMSAYDPKNPSFPLQRPVSAIGEVCIRYVVPRLMNQATCDAGTSVLPPDELAKRTDSTLRTYQDAREFCAKNGAEFGIVYVPFPKLLGGEDVIPHKTMVEWTKQRGVLMIDVEPRFEREDAARLSKDGVHPTAYGDEVIADEITKQWPLVEEALAANASQRATQK